MITDHCRDSKDLKRLVDAAVARFRAMTPERRHAHIDAQRKSWVIGEMLLEHPEMTRERAEEIYSSIY